MDSGRQVRDMVLLSLIVVIRFLLLLSIDIVVVRVVVAMLKKEEIGIVPGCVMMLGWIRASTTTDTFPSINKFWVPILDSLFPTYRAVPRAGKEFYGAVQVFDRSLVSDIVVSDDRIMCRQKSRSAARGGTPHKVLSIEAPVFTLDELNRMIENFGQKALVGEGSYDHIFCAKLCNGKQVAIKKLDTSSSPELDSGFAAQLSTISRLKNEHFMTLMGYCLEGNNRILVYEFATKGSLHDVYMIISWRTCLKFPDEPKVSDEAKDLICHLLCDVESRLGTEGVEEIKVHPWFKGVNWDMLYEMEAAYKPIVTRELDTQNFEKFQPDDHEDLQPSDAASRPISPIDARRSRTITREPATSTFQPMDKNVTNVILAYLDTMSRDLAMANERLDRMVGQREQVRCLDTRQEEGRSSCELRGKNVIPYTPMNLVCCVVASKSQVGVVVALPSVEVIESSFCDTLGDVRSREDQTLVVSTQALVDPLDDEIDSSRKNNLCPFSASPYNSSKTLLPIDESIRTLVDFCASQVSNGVYRVDLDGARDSLNMLCGKSLASSFVHRDHVYGNVVNDVFVNGKVCKDPNLATVDDFFASGLNGLIPLHTHPRATELITVLEGTIYAGFLLPAENIFKSRLFSKILKPGDVFVVPQGLVHFQYNVGRTNATILASFNSQNSGFVMIPNIIFASDPPILDDVLAKGFQLNKKVIQQLRKKFA
ncbi:putative protein kinase [Capsicum annuum]|nr:putative protein kinase [Capsicum annuum]